LHSPHHNQRSKRKPQVSEHAFRLWLHQRLLHQPLRLFTSQVPPTMRFVMDGQMPEWLQAKDLILQIIGEISVAGA
jgi:hypothetical protein